MKIGIEANMHIRPCSLVFLTLVLLTLITWAVGMARLGGIQVSLMVFALALFKGLLIGDWFMGLKSIHGLWRWVIHAWLGMVGMLVGMAFILSERAA